MGNKGLSEEKVEKHESYGMVGINRCSSSGSFLFGSMANHRSFITLSVKRASRRRSLANDRFSAESRDLIEIEMTHSQFGELITSPGMGDGVPCTIRAFDGELLEPCPEPERMVSKFEGDLKATTKETVSLLQDLTNQLDEALLPGNKALGKKELGVLLQGLKSALQSVTDSIPFIEQSFGEEMEVQIDKAITEIEAVGSHMIHKTGLNALARANADLALPDLRTPMLGKGESEGK